MNKLLALFICFSTFHVSWSQESDIRAVIDRMFQSMYARDTAQLRSCFIPAARLMSYTYDAKGNSRAKAETVSDFIRGVGLIGEAELEERLTSWQCLVDDGIASVWTPYEFYVDKQFSHCGVNSFELINVQGAWKISQITDTRRRDRCAGEMEKKMEIDSTINAWHHAASVADETTFFGTMTEDAIYIGTDATERWLRDELAAWSKKYFERETAWEFRTLSRNVTLGPGGQIAWFDELLDTWMGVCRSTGIVVLMDGMWKIRHYHLSIAVPNEKIDAYRAIIGKE